MFARYVLCTFHFHDWQDSKPLLCQRCGVGNFKTFNEGMDRTMARFLFVVVAVFGGIGTLIWLINWIGAHA